LKHRPFEELNAGADCGKPFSQPGAASACCSCMVVATVTITTPSTASAATIAITANVVLFTISKISINSFFLKFSPKNYHLLDKLSHL
jgi:hypothetical protein